MSVTHEPLRSSVQNFNLLIIHFNLPSKKENNHSSFNSHDQIARYWQLLLSQQDNKAHFNLLSLNFNCCSRNSLNDLTRFKSALTLSFKNTCLVTISTSSFLMLKIFAIMTVMYWNCFLTVIIFTSQSFVR